MATQEVFQQYSDACDLLTETCEKILIGKAVFMKMAEQHRTYCDGMSDNQWKLSDKEVDNLTRVITLLTTKVQKVVDLELKRKELQ